MRAVEKTDVARTPRIVIPDLAHHVTQRGVRRQDVFFSEDDMSFYLRLLSKHSSRVGVEIIGFCLMDNHVHHLVVPPNEKSLSKVFRIVHQRYAQETNRKYGWTGHLWQERFYSSPVEDVSIPLVLRYIENNPVVAEMVRHASDYPWSSAAAHCGLRESNFLTYKERLIKLLPDSEAYPEFLNEAPEELEIRRLKKCTERDLPFGSARFIDDLERKMGRKLRPLARGRPKVQ